MSQENVEIVRALRRLSSRRSLLRVVGGVACVGVIAVSATPARGAFPGRNGRIAYLDTNIGGISSVRPNGSGRRRLVRRHGGAPEYSPRGDRIVFSRFFRIEPTDTPGITYFDVSRLELVGADGRGRTVLTGGDDFSPAWAPDEKHIVFARNGPCDRYYNAEGECPPRVQRDKKYGVLIRSPGGRTRVVTREGLNPRWSPDGNWISYLSVDSEGGTGLYAMRPRGSRSRRIVSPTAGLPLQSHDWSPDGSRIALSYSTRNGYGIAEIRSDGTGLRLRLRNGFWPAYSPDGRWIVFSRPDERHCGFAQHAIWIMPARGGHPRALHDRSRHRICGSAPDWQPLP